MKSMAAITATIISNLALRNNVLIPQMEEESIKGHHTLQASRGGCHY